MLMQPPCRWHARCTWYSRAAGQTAGGTQLNRRLFPNSTAAAPEYRSTAAWGCLERRLELTARLRVTTQGLARRSARSLRGGMGARDMRRVRTEVHTRRETEGLQQPCHVAAFDWCVGMAAALL